MLSPKRTKFRKPHRGRLRGVASNGDTLVFGEYGLQALESAWVTARQIEATRRSVIRHVKKSGNLWVRIFPDKSVSVKPPETRMGSGKGSPDHWVAVVKPGHVLIEVNGISQELAYQVLKGASYKLPIRTKFLSKI
uniref:Ribosomal protein L16 n=1 Tax=Cryptomonas sp. CCAC 1634B TaxID=2051848 RepID=A0A679C9X2_9CRYP|nr:ribosomal protein L16 [Cryptomonas sp. CCAC 1634B]